MVSARVLACRGVEGLDVCFEVQEAAVGFSPGFELCQIASLDLRRAVQRLVGDDVVDDERGDLRWIERYGNGDQILFAEVNIRRCVMMILVFARHPGRQDHPQPTATVWATFLP